jgi:hypothetical protein
MIAFTTSWLFKNSLNPSQGFWKNYLAFKRWSSLISANYPQMNGFELPQKKDQSLSVGVAGFVKKDKVLEK